MSNLSILQQNMLDGIETKEAKDWFLKCLDKGMTNREAEASAWSMDVIFRRMDVWLPLAWQAFPDTPDEVQSDLRKFIEVRAKNYLSKIASHQTLTTL